MSRSVFFYALLLLVGTFMASISQVLLKKVADRHFDNPLKDYLHPFVLAAYSIFIASTFLSILAYRGIPLSLGPVLEATGYIYVTYFGVKIFKEKFNSKKAVALALIIFGIIVYSFG